MGEGDTHSGTSEPEFDWEQYNRLIRCIKTGDLSEWNKPYLAVVEEIKAISGSDIWKEQSSATPRCLGLPVILRALTAGR